MSCLPRPVRFKADSLSRLLRAEAPEAMAVEFAKPHNSHYLIQQMAVQMPFVRKLIAGEQFSVELVGLIATELAFQFAGGVIVELTQPLIEQLLNTDLDVAEVLSPEDVRLPFDTVFLRAPTNAPSLALKVGSNSRVLDGIYLRRFHVEANDTWPHGYEGIDILCVAQPPIGNGIEDDFTCFFSLGWRMGESHTNIRQIVEQGFVEHGLGSRGDYSQALGDLESHLGFVLKALLYLNLPEARRRPINEGTELAKRMRGLGPKKQARLARQALRTYDRIEVGPTEEEYAAASEAAGGSRTVAPHWRRGHFRRQRIGEGRTQSRIVWIKPVLVAFAAGVGAPPTPKNYRVSA